MTAVSPRGQVCWLLISGLVIFMAIAFPLRRVMTGSDGTPLPGFAMSSHGSGAMRLHSVTLGDGPEQVAFLHGLGGTVRYWTCGSVLPLFPGVQTRLLDLYGFGDSPRPWCRYTIERHIAALHRTLGDGPPRTLVGHSMGAALALMYAARYPEHVRSLCLISLPHYGSPGNAYAWFRSQHGGWIYTNMVATALGCMFTRRVAGHWLPLLIRDVPEIVARDLVKHNALSSTTSLWNVLYRNDLALDSGKLPLDIPVICIHGSEDDTAPPAAVRSLTAAHPGWSLVELAADHHPWLRHPDLCHKVIRGLLLP